MGLDYGMVRETGARKGTRQRGFVRKDKGCSRKSQQQCSIHVQTQQRQFDGGWETVSFQESRDCTKSSEEPQSQGGPVPNTDPVTIL